MSDVPSASLLIVEDDPDHRQILKDILEIAGYRVKSFAAVGPALAAVRAEAFDLALLDLYVGAEDGMAVAEALRLRSPYTAIVILTGQGGLESAVRSIDLQIQKYLLKPARPDELRRTVAEQIALMRAKRQSDRLAGHMRAAVEALAPEDRPQPAPAQLTSGPLDLNLGQQLARYDGRELELTTTEFYLLWGLVQSEGRPVSAYQLCRAALDYDVSDYEARSLIKPHLSRLRKKIEPDPRRPRHLITVRRQGYLWRP